MKYYATFKNGKVDGFWQRENNDESQCPSYIPENEAIEITENQFNNINYLKLENDVVSFDSGKMLSKIRAERDSKLSKTDWIMLSDSQASAACKTAFETYRQSLRDFPDTVDLNNIVWPTEPEYVTE